MHEILSRSQRGIVYVFDEFKLPASMIGTHPDLSYHGRVIDTLAVSLEPFSEDTRLIEILQDCSGCAVEILVDDREYDDAIDVIKWGLSRDVLARAANSVYVHIVERIIRPLSQTCVKKYSNLS